MRNRINLFAFAATLAGAGGVHLGHPASAGATMSPTPIEWQYCCEGARTRCCGNAWCAITPRGCATG